MKAGAIYLLVLSAIVAPLLTCGDIDYSTPEMQTIRKEYLQKKKEHDQMLAEQLRKLAQQYLEAARQELTRQKRTRNITGMAVAGKSISIFEKCLTQIEETGNFEIQGKIRRELVETMDQFRQRKDAIQAEYDQSMTALKADSLARFGAIAAPGEKDPDPAKMEALFDALLVEPKKPDPAEEATASEEGGEPGAEGEQTGKRPKKPEVKVPDVLASSGESSEWEPFARWHATVAGLEVLNVPIAGRAETEESSRFSPLTESTIKMRYEAIKAISPDDGSCFRIKSIAGKNPADLVQWPSARNGWTMQIRVRPGARVPSEHSIELQVGRSGSQSPLPEGQPANVPPADAPAEASTQDSSPEEAQPAPAKPSHSPVAAEHKVISVTARTDWWFSGVNVKKGDLVKIAVTGLWSCGSGGEMVDADGYPRNDSFRGYYRDATVAKRLLPSAAYGALLIRIGKEGRLGAIGTSASIIAPSDGILYFAINEAADPQARGDNKGSLTIQIKRYDVVE